MEPLPPVSAFPAVRKNSACNHCSFSSQGRVPRLEVGACCLAPLTKTCLHGSIMWAASERGLHLGCPAPCLGAESARPADPVYPRVHTGWGFGLCANALNTLSRTHTPNSRTQVADAAPTVWCKCAVLEGRGASIHLFLAPALRHPGALQHLLAALMPGGDVPLVELGLHGVGFCPGDAVAVLRGCTLLRTLRRLDFLTKRYNPEAGAD